MKRYIILNVIIFCSCFLYSQGGKIKLAVSPFDDSITLAAEIENAGKGLSKKLENKFSSVDRFTIRKRGTINEYLNTLSMVESGMTFPDKLINKSSTLNIDYLTVGTVSKIHRTYEIDARTVNIDNWQIIHSHGVTAGSIQEASDEIGWYISETFTEKYLKRREKDTEEKPVVSVFSFRDFNRMARRKGISGVFSEILNSQLGSFNNIVTVERKYSRALINEKILEMAGITENESGNNDFHIKKIEYKLTGDLRIFRDLICINYKLFNTADGRLVYSGSREATHPSQLRKIAWGVANTTEEVLTNRIGTLKLKTVPPEAEILIDNVPAGSSPLLISLPKGKHSLRVKRSGYQTESRILNIKSRKINNLTIKLSTIQMQLLQKAFMLESRNKWRMAINAYDKFIKQYSDTAEANSAYYRKGHILMIQLKDYKAALDTFKTLVERYPDTMTRAEAYYGMAKTYYLMGMKSEAVKTKNYLLDKYGSTYAAQEAKKLQW